MSRQTKRKSKYATGTAHVSNTIFQRFETGRGLGRFHPTVPVSPLVKLPVTNSVSRRCKFISAGEATSAVPSLLLARASYNSFMPWNTTPITLENFRFSSIRKPATSRLPYDSKVDTIVPVFNFFTPNIFLLYIWLQVDSNRGDSSSKWINYYTPVYFIFTYHWLVEVKINFL